MNILYFILFFIPSVNGIMESAFQQLYNLKNISLSMPEIGITTSAYPTEGGYLSDGRTYSIWDRFVRTYPSPIKDNTNGDQTCKSYYFWKQDIDNIIRMNLSNYMLSISWSRIFPNSNYSLPNYDAVIHYKKILEYLKENNIKSWVIIFHWDLPLYLQQSFGGWISKHIIPYFVQYSNFCFLSFAHLVDNWITIRDPSSFCINGYSTGIHAPGIQSQILVYPICHNLLLAHAHVYHLYKNNYNQGNISIIFRGNMYYPQNINSLSDIHLTETLMIKEWGWLLDVLFFGDYPAIIKSNIDKQLPQFSIEETNLVRYSFDFLFIEHLSSFDVFMDQISFVKHVFPKHLSIPTSISNIHIYPASILDLLLWIKSRYKLYFLSSLSSIVVISGVPTYSSQIYDDIRSNLLTQIFGSILDSINIYNMPITTFFIHSLLDDFQWEYGFTQSFGLFYVNMSSPQKLRIPKRSVKQLFPFY